MVNLVPEGIVVALRTCSKAKNAKFACPIHSHKKFLCDFNVSLNMNIQNTEDLDSVALNLCEKINKAFNASCKKRKQIRYKQQWFNTVLAKYLKVLVGIRY